MNAANAAALIDWPVICRADDKVQFGVIFGINSSIVFVRFAGEAQAKPAKIEDLQLVPPHPNYGDPGTALEDRAHQLARKVLGGTTMDPALIPETVEKEWGYFMPLLA